MWGKTPISILFILLIIILSSIAVPAQSNEDYFRIIESKYNNKKFSNTLEFVSSFPEDVFEINIIFFKAGVETKNETTKVKDGNWIYTTEVSSWVTGTYDVTLFAYDNNKTVLDEGNIRISIESGLPPGSDPGSVFDTSFLNKFKDKSYTGQIEMETTVPNEIDTIQIKIFTEEEELLDEKIDTSKNSWSFEKDVSDWDTGKYEVNMIAFDTSDEIIDSAAFQIEVKAEEPFYMPMFCAIMLIIFIVIFVVLFVLTLLKHKKIMAQLRFEPKNVEKKLPIFCFVSMLITLLYVLAGTSALITAELDLLFFLVFLACLGLFMLVTYWTFSNRTYPTFIFYLIFGILAIIAISLTAAWSPTDAIGLLVGSALIATGFILLFIFLLIYWLSSRRGFIIPMVAVILSLVFFIIHLVLIVLSAIDLFVSYWIALIVGSILLSIALFIGWIIIREDIFYFETREEGKTHRGMRKTLNMFDILSTPTGLMHREYDRKVMAKISYEQTHDKKVRMEVIQLRDWETNAGKAQGKRIMGVFVSKMSGKEGPMFNKEQVAESVKYTTYSSDTQLDEKLKLAKSYGFQVMESGKERGLDYYDLELMKKPLFGLGAPTMGGDKPKMDFEKDSGWMKGKDKAKDKKPEKGKGSSERESDYDYEADREKEREAREHEAREARERERDSDMDHRRDSRRRERSRYEDDDDVDDWSRDRQRREHQDRRRGQDRDRGYTRYERDRDRDRDRHRIREERRRERDDDHSPDRWPVQREEAPTEKPKKRPPPPKIVSD